MQRQAAYNKQKENEDEGSVDDLRHCHSIYLIQHTNIVKHFLHGCEL